MTATTGREFDDEQTRNCQRTPKRKLQLRADERNRLIIATLQNQVGKKREKLATEKTDNEILEVKFSIKLSASIWHNLFSFRFVLHLKWKCIMPERETFTICCVCVSVRALT